MSHRADTSGVPYISSISPSALSTAGAGQSLVITGNALSPTTEVDIGSLGVITNSVFAHVTAVSQTLTLTVTVAAIPDPTEEVDITCSNGGVTGNSKPITHGFTPLAISGLSLWLDADDASTVTESGGAISQWNDKSGNSRHVLQGDASRQPTYTAAGLNGKAVVTIANDYLYRDDAIGFVGNPAITVLVVLKKDAVSNSRPFQLGAVGSGTGTQKIYGFGADSSWGYNGGNNTFANDAFGAGVATVGAWRCNASETFGDSEFFHSGVEATATSSSSGGSSVNIPASGTATTVGHGWATNNEHTANGYWSNGFIAELIVYDSSLSNTDRETVEEYLADKWGISLP